MAASGKFKVAVAIAAEDQATSKSRRIFNAIGQSASALRGKVRGAFGALTSMRSALVGLTAGYAGVRGAQELLRWAEETDKTAKYAKQVGFAVEQLDSWRYAGRRLGVEAGTLDKSIQFLSKNRGEMIAGEGQLRTFLSKTSPELKTALENARTAEDATRIGIEALRDLNGKDAEQAALATKLFGRSGAAMILFAKAEASAVDALIEKKKKYGAITAKTGLDAEDFADALEDAKTAVGGLKNTLGGALLPVLTPAVNRLAEWIAQNRELVSLKAERWAEKLADAIEWLTEEGLPKTAKLVEDIGKNWNQIVDAAKVLAVTYIGGKLMTGMLALVNQAALFRTLMTGAGAAGVGGKVAAGVAGLGGGIAALGTAIIGLTAAIGYLKKEENEVEHDRRAGKRSVAVLQESTAARARLQSLSPEDRADVLAQSAAEINNRAPGKASAGEQRRNEQNPEFWRLVRRNTERRIRGGATEGVGGFAPIPTSYAQMAAPRSVLDVNITASELPLGMRVGVTQPKTDRLQEVRPRLEVSNRGAGGGL